MPISNKVKRATAYKRKSKNKAPRTPEQKAALFAQLRQTPGGTTTPTDGRAWILTSTTATDRLILGQHLKHFGAITVFSEQLPRSVWEMQSKGFLKIQVMLTDEEKQAEASAKAAKAKPAPPAPPPGSPLAKASSTSSTSAPAASAAAPSSTPSK